MSGTFYEVDDDEIARMIARRRAIETLGFTYWDVDRNRIKGGALTGAERMARSRARYRAPRPDEAARKREYRARKKADATT
jgi:hypothetical protein